MSDQQQDFSELDALLAALDAKSLTDADHTRLDELASTNLAARRRYIEKTFLIGELQYRFSPQPKAADAWSNSPIAAVPVPTSNSPVLGFLGYANAMLSKPVLWSILGVGLMFCIYAAVITWGIRDRGPHAPRGSEEIVATITDSSDTQWSGPSEKSETRNLKAEIASGEPLQITSGLVELKLKQGATLLVEGPATWSIDGNNRATLKRGKLVAKVPQKAVGFTLDTPTAQIVDLGTEFGVEISQTGTAELHVVKGQVDVRGAKGSGKSGPGTLEAGQSVQISAQGTTVKKTEPTPDKFKRLVEAGNKKDENLPEPLAGPTTGLVAYYPFENDTRDHAAEFVENVGTSSDDLKTVGPSEFLAGEVGRGLRFMGGYASAPFSPDVQLPPTFTIEAWIVAEALTTNYQRCVINWGGNPAALVYHFSINGKGMELGIGQADGTLVRAAGGELKIERWQHVAGVADGKKLHVYIGGQEVASRDFNGTLAANDHEGLGVGDSQGGEAPTIRLHGAIDELAIWNIAFTPEEIAAHVNAGRHGYGFNHTKDTR